MLGKLLELLEKEQKAIKDAPIHFTIACIVSVIIIGILWYLGFSTALSLQTHTIEAYKGRFETFNSAFKENPSQSLQVMIYTNDPNSEKLIPQMTNSPALAYSDDGTKSTFSWSIKSQSWK
jgi:hypothetical protein